MVLFKLREKTSTLINTYHFALQHRHAILDGWVMFSIQNVIAL